MSNLEATIVVKFGEDVGDALALVELDGTRNGYYDDEGEWQIYSTFAPGYEPHFWIHYEPSLRVSDVKYSAGQVVPIPGNRNNLNGVSGAMLQHQFNKKQQLQFIKENLTNDKKAEAELSYYPIALHSVSFPPLSNSPAWHRDIRKMTIDGNKPAIADVSMTIQTDLYKLRPPSMSLQEDDTYPILVVFYMENA